MSQSRVLTRMAGKVAAKQTDGATRENHQSREVKRLGLADADANAGV